MKRTYNFITKQQYSNKKQKLEQNWIERLPLFLLYECEDYLDFKDAFYFSLCSKTLRKHLLQKSRFRKKQNLLSLSLSFLVKNKDTFKIVQRLLDVELKRDELRSDNLVPYTDYNFVECKLVGDTKRLYLYDLFVIFLAIRSGFLDILRLKLYREHFCFDIKRDNVVILNSNVVLNDFLQRCVFCICGKLGNIQALTLCNDIFDSYEILHEDWYQRHFEILGVYAAENNHLHLIKHLLDFDYIYSLKHAGFIHTTAASNGHVAILELCEDYFRIYSPYIDDYNVENSTCTIFRNAILSATRYGQLSVLAYYFTTRRDFVNNYVEFTSKELLKEAIYYGQSEVFEYLIRQLQCKVSFKLLRYAASCGQKQIMIYIFEKHHQFCSKDMQFWSDLLYDVIESNNVECFQYCEQWIYRLFGENFEIVITEYLCNALETEQKNIIQYLKDKPGLDFNQILETLFLLYKKYDNSMIDWCIDQAKQQSFTLNWQKIIPCFEKYILKRYNIEIY